MNEANAAENHLTLFVADDGAISYELDSRKLGRSSGPLELNKPLVTGWADWQLVVDRILPHAEQWMDFTPAKGDSANQLPDGVRVRVEQNGETLSNGFRRVGKSPFRRPQIQLAFPTVGARRRCQSRSS